MKGREGQVFIKQQKGHIFGRSKEHNYAYKLCGIERILFKMVLYNKHICIIHLTCLTEESI